jgi:hypothetical protein
VEKAKYIAKEMANKAGTVDMDENGNKFNLEEYADEETLATPNASPVPSRKSPISCARLGLTDSQLQSSSPLPKRRKCKLK